MIYVLWRNNRPIVTTSGSMFELPIPRESDVITLEDDLESIQQFLECDDLEPELEAPVQQLKCCQSKAYLLFQ